MNKILKYYKVDLADMLVIYDDMDLAESMLKYVINYVLEHCPEEMEFFNNFIDKTLLDRLNNVINSDFGRITYTDAIKELEKPKISLIFAAGPTPTFS